MADSMDNNFAVVAPDGSVQFTFAGNILASGLILPTNITGSLDPLNSVEWLDQPPSGLATGLITSLRTGRNLIIRAWNAVAGDATTSQEAVLQTVDDSYPGLGRPSLRASLAVDAYGNSAGVAFNNGVRSSVVDSAGNYFDRWLDRGYDRKSNYIVDMKNSAEQTNGKLAAMCAYWDYGGVPADTSNRFFASSVNVYFDNTQNVWASLGGSGIGNDGIMVIREAGVYHIQLGMGNHTGGVSGNYSGARFARNGVTHYDLSGGHSAATMDTDGFSGVHGQSGLILNVAAGEYFRAEGWSQPGYSMYIWMNIFRLPV